MRSTAERSTDRRVAAIAGGQRGAITRRQLSQAGLGAGAIAHRVACGRLHRVHRGIYLVGHAVAAEGALEIAAVLASGPDALISHRTAAELWGLVRPRPRPADIDVTVVGRRPRRRAGINMHETDSLSGADRRQRAGIPVTAPARTVVDLAGVTAAREAERAFEQALVLRLARVRDLEAALARKPTARGAPVTQALLSAAREPALTRSHAEERLLELIRRAGIDPPRANVRVRGHEVDLLWASDRLVVEVDGFRYHGHREAFERDRRRDARLQLAGYRVLRVTWRQIEREPLLLVRNLALALAGGSVIPCSQP